MTSVNLKCRMTHSHPLHSVPFLSHAIYWVVWRLRGSLLQSSNWLLAHWRTGTMTIFAGSTRVMQRDSNEPPCHDSAHAVGRGNVGCQTWSASKEFLCLIRFQSKCQFSNQYSYIMVWSIFIPDNKPFQFDIIRFWIMINKNELHLIQSKNVYRLNHSGTAVHFKFRGIIIQVN